MIELSNIAKTTLTIRKCCNNIVTQEVRRARALGVLTTNKLNIVSAEIRYKLCASYQGIVPGPGIPAKTYTLTYTRRKTHGNSEEYTGTESS